MYQKNANGALKPRITIGVGDVPGLSMGFDTGSSGLHVFADASLTRPGSGVQCTDSATTVTYGNPARIILSGVICYARLHLGTYTTPQAVPIAYLTKASCPTKMPKCHLPDLTDTTQMGGYGVLGVGIIGSMSGNGHVPNPIITLPAPYGTTYSVRLTPNGGELVLGSREPPNAVRFQLSRDTLPGARWSLGQTCLFVNTRPIGTCIYISFDTGNPAPWLHNATNPAIPESLGVVQPGTRIGFAPAGNTTEAIAVVAGTQPNRNLIKDVQIAGALPMTNVSINVFFGNIVTYDNQTGTISFAPALSSQ